MWPLLSLFLNVLVPVFALVLIGYFAGPRLSLEGRTLSRLAYFILVPAFVFNLISTAKIEAGLAVRMVVYIVLAQSACALAGFLAARLLGRSGQVTAAYVLVAAFGNIGNFGLPIIQFRFGDEALIIATVYFLALNVLSFVIGVAAANWQRGGHVGAAAAVLKTPAILALLPAFVLNWLGLTPPLLVSRTVALLAGAMIPTMLLALGLQLAEMERPRLSLDVLVASGVRLLVGPALAALLALPFGLAGIERSAGILQSAMPVAVFASIIAIENELLPGFVTTTVLFSTLASLVTLTVILALV